jgi:hypothetical protein
MGTSGDNHNNLFNPESVMPANKNDSLFEPFLHKGASMNNDTLLGDMS